MSPEPVIEVHLTIIHRREEIRRHSCASKVATAVIAGPSPGGYRAAIRAMRGTLQRVAKP
jgi:3-dehydroquinate dehydratase II